MVREVGSTIGPRGWGKRRQDVVAITYEYGNTFLMASGLLNALVMLDVYDRANEPCHRCGTRCTRPCRDTVVCPRCGREIPRRTA